MSSLLFISNSVHFFYFLSNSLDMVIDLLEIYKETIPYAVLIYASLFSYIFVDLARLDALRYELANTFSMKLAIFVFFSLMFYLSYGFSLFILSYFAPNPEVVNQLSPVVCHLSSSFPPVTYPNPYQGCYVNFNSLEGSSLISSFKLKSYPYMVFGGVEPYTTSMTIKVPFFVSGSRLFVLLEKIF